MAISRDDNETTELDVLRAKDAARLFPFPWTGRFCMLFLRKYVVDEQKGIKDPRDVRCEA